MTFEEYQDILEYIEVIKVCVNDEEDGSGYLMDFFKSGGGKDFINLVEKLVDER